LADPKISLASFASIVVGATAAGRDGEMAWGWLIVTVLGVFLVEVAKNASGEVVDFDSGADLGVADADRSPFSGGKRVIVDGLLTRRQTLGIAAVCYGAAFLVGLAIVMGREPRVLWLAAAGVALAYFYHAPPLRLSYRGWGELAVGLAYGPLIAAGTYLVQRRDLTAGWASGPLGLLVAAFLWINEFPDFEADRGAGKRTWVVRLGRPRAAAVFAGLVVAAFALLALLPFQGLPIGVLGGFVAVPFGAAACRRLLRDPTETARIVPAQALTLAAFVAYALGAGAGLLISP
jgi:1,4-dihydroxy-2-naphthoate octaprenyltransferase